VTACLWQLLDYKDKGMGLARAYIRELLVTCSTRRWATPGGGLLYQNA
jgi:hypothetical protein